MPDSYLRHNADSYAGAFAALLPQGIAWPRRRNSVLMRVVRGLSQVWGRDDSRAGDLLERESDPRLTLELLEDWEGNFGLPDPCFPDATSISERRDQLIWKMTLLGGQSREWFIELAAWLGYTITIGEFAPFMCGVSRAGDTRKSVGDPDDAEFYRWQIGPPEMRFYWVVHVGDLGLVWFRATEGQAGVDPHLRITRAENLECLFRRLKPAHTEVLFDYAGESWPDDSMAGTP